MHNHEIFIALLVNIKLKYNNLLLLIAWDFCFLGVCGGEKASLIFVILYSEEVNSCKKGPL